MQSAHSSGKGIPFIQEASQVESRIIFLLVMCMLSSDSLNPVKVFTSALDLPSWPVTYACAALLLNVAYVNILIILYAGCRVFFHSILSIFFREVKIVGMSNIPAEGPVIFTGNHGNQFVDALMVLCNCRHKVGFMIAEKSMHRPVVGHFARAIGCIPVVRAQDTAKRGTGRIRIAGDRVIGEGTAFTAELGAKFKLRLAGEAEELRVREVLSDAEALLEKPRKEDGEGEGGAPAAAGIGQAEAKGSPSVFQDFQDFDVIAYIDQATSFSKVWEAFAEGNCLGIFPEGGSHDRTDLLPLKAGVAVIAFGALDKFKSDVPVVPVGLNYAKRNRFRGSAIIEFGAPIHITPEDAELYARGEKRQACANFLAQVEDGMRSVIVTAPDYEKLQLLHAVRRLWVQDRVVLSAGEKQDLSRRFAAGYRMLLDRGDAEVLRKMEAFEGRLRAYQDRLDTCGLRDYQVPMLQRRRTWRMVYKLAHMTSVLLLASVPALLLNAPVGLLARHIAERERVKALKASRVKLEAKDVVLSKKIVFSIVAVPALWIFYAVLMALCGVEGRLVLLLFLSFPVFSYIGVISVEAGIVDLKDIRPYLMQLLPDRERVIEALPAERARLRRDLRAFVAQVGPELGPIFQDKVIDWTGVARQEKARAGSRDAEEKDKDKTL